MKDEKKGAACMLQMQKAPSDPVDGSHKCCNLATRESLLVCVREEGLPLEKNK